MAVKKINYPNYVDNTYIAGKVRRALKDGSISPFKRLTFSQRDWLRYLFIRERAANYTPQGIVFWDNLNRNYRPIGQENYNILRNIFYRPVIRDLDEFM